MGYNKKRWWHYLYFEFYLNTYLLCVETRLLYEPLNRVTYDICRLRITILRRKIFEVDLYRRLVR